MRETFSALRLELNRAAAARENEVLEAVTGASLQIRPLKKTIAAPRDQLSRDRILHEDRLRERARLSRDRGDPLQRTIADLEEAWPLNPEDRISQIYIDRCEHDLQAPPSADRGGVWTMTSQ